MTKALEAGQKFLVPLENGDYLPGYVVKQGNLFALVNIFRETQSNRNEPQHFKEDEILFRDWLIGDHVFSRSKKIIEVSWILFRTKKVAQVLPLTIDGVILGSHGTEHVVALDGTGELRRPPTEEDFRTLPKHGIKAARYYSLSVEAKFAGKSVMLDPETQKYVIS